MKTFLQLSEERDHSLKPVVMAFGRMNPPTVGHEKLVNKVKEIADQHSAPHHIILSHSQDSKKNPLAVDQKVEHARNAFPNTNIEAASKSMPTFLHHAKRLSDAGHRHLIMVAGSDRVEEYKRLLNQYNGKPGQHHFDKIEVKSAGQRDPDAEGTEGMSASKMREHATNNNFGEFRRGLPAAMKDHHAKKLFKDVRNGLGLNENINRGLFKAIFITGGPGSGKDIIIREGIAEAKAVEINANVIHGYLMDKVKLAESSKDLKREAIRNRLPLIINGTADNFDMIHNIKEELEELGYSTMMVYVDTTDDTSKQRNMGLRRMFAESIRQEKWQKAQVNKNKFHEEFDDFNLFDNNDDITIVEESITDVYQHVNDFLDRSTVNETSFRWLREHNKLTLDHKVVKLFESDPVLRISKPLPVKRFYTDKETEKGKKSKWLNEPASVLRGSGIGDEFTSRGQNGGAYPVSGLGGVTYRESVDNKYIKEGSTVGARKSFSQFLNKESVDSPSSEMGVSGTLGGAGNKEPMQTPYTQFGQSGISIEKKNNKKPRFSSDKESDKIV